MVDRPIDERLNLFVKKLSHLDIYLNKNTKRSIASVSVLNFRCSSYGAYIISTTNFVKLSSNDFELLNVKIQEFYVAFVIHLSTLLIF